MINAYLGFPPIAAMSLMFEARDFQPMSLQLLVAKSKCTPSTMVSVVKSSVPPFVFHAAASSPLSTINW